MKKNILILLFTINLANAKQTLCMSNNGQANANSPSSSPNPRITNYWQHPQANVSTHLRAFAAALLKQGHEAGKN